MLILKDEAAAFARVARSLGAGRGTAFIVPDLESRTVGLAAVFTHTAKAPEATIWTTFVGAENELGQVRTIPVKALLDFLKTSKPVEGTRPCIVIPEQLGTAVGTEKADEILGHVRTWRAKSYGTDSHSVRLGMDSVKADVATWKGVLGHAAQERSRFAFEAVRISSDPDKPEAEIVATDGRRLVLVEGRSFFTPNSDAVPDKISVATSAIKAGLAGLVKSSKADNRLNVRWPSLCSEMTDAEARPVVGTGFVTIAAPRVLGSFPDWKNVIPTAFTPVQVGTEAFAAVMAEVEPTIRALSATGDRPPVLLVKATTEGGARLRVGGAHQAEKLTKFSWGPCKAEWKSEIFTSAASEIRSHHVGLNLDFVRAAADFVGDGRTGFTIGLHETAPEIRPVLFRSEGRTVVIMPVSGKYQG